MLTPVLLTGENMSEKADNDKIRIDLVDPAFIEDVCKVLAFGAKKYSPNNWQTLDDHENRYYAAAMRHLLAWRKGHKKDKESGLSHLTHAATNIMFLLWFARKRR